MIVLAGCSRPASVPAHVLARHPAGDPCDEAAWQHLASSPLQTPWGRVEAYGHAEPTPVELPRTGSGDPLRLAV